MAVAIDAAKLETAAGVPAAASTRLLAVATEMHNRYIGTATVPDAISDEAVIRCAAYLYATPAAPVRSAKEGEIETQYAISHHSALRHSGAMALLSPYKRRRAGAISGRAE